MYYEVYGEFELPRHRLSGKKTLNLKPEALRDFWDDIDNEHPGLSSAKGCYVYGLRAGKGIRPWYVGRTGKSFKAECFTPGKRLHYRNALDYKKTGTPILILVARCTKGGQFFRGSVRMAEADFLEKMLIGMALGQNQNLLNKKDTKYLRKIQVPGLLNSRPGPPPAPVRSLKRALGQR